MQYEQFYNSRNYVGLMNNGTVRMIVDGIYKDFFLKNGRIGNEGILVYEYDSFEFQMEKSL